jgi:hypothetical protein
MTKPKANYYEKIDKLKQRKEFLLEKKEKIEEELKTINTKILDYEKRMEVREIDDTVILLKKTGLKITDIKRLIKQGKIQELIEEE